MGSRTNTHPRCEHCLLHPHLCICADFRPFATRTRLALIWHRIEAVKPTNTGRLALRTLENSESYIRGIQNAPADLSPLEDPERRLLVLYPAPDARVLTQAIIDEDPRPITLAVPDATWTQARRSVNREPALANAEKVIPPPGPPTQYQLRQEHHDDYLATIEAIARAFGVLEGPEAQAELERIFLLMVDRTLQMRNQPPQNPDRPKRKGWMPREEYEAYLREKRAADATAAFAASKDD